MTRVLHLLAAVLIYAVLFASVVLLGLLSPAEDSIELSASKWSCQALDPADGECAVYSRTP